MQYENFSVFIKWRFHLIFSRVIKPEEGKKLADSWGAAFMESSAKENEVTIDASYLLIRAGRITFLTLIHTLTMIFSQRRLPWRFSSGSFWRWRKLMETHPRRRRSVLWCKKKRKKKKRKCIQDISKLICWRQEAQPHQLANRDLTDTRHCSGPSLLHYDTRLIYIARQLPR